MSPETEILRVVLVTVVLATVGYAWHLAGRDRWYPFLQRRFMYGVPWGSALMIVAVVGFYLFAQSGLNHWDDPVVTAFVTWSYSYPLGMLSAGFAHGSPAHLRGNMLATLVLAPLVEYAWGHYPPERRQRTRLVERFRSYDFPPPALPDDETVTGSSQYQGSADFTSNGDGHWLRTNPWARALIVFPLVVIVVSILSSAFTLRPSIGFSGAVFAMLGFALVVYPLTTVISIVVIAGISVLVSAFRNPILVATVGPSVPGPPGWAGVSFSGHMLGFLMGVMLALYVLARRDERPEPTRLAFATVFVILVQGLWAFSLGGDDVYRLLQAPGIIFVLVIGLIIIAGGAREDRPLEQLNASGYRVLSWIWLGLLLVGGLAIVAFDGIGMTTVALTVAVIVWLAIPALAAVLPDRAISRPISRRHLFIGAILFITVMIALPGFWLHLPGMDDDSVPDDRVVEIEDYTITYAENATSPIIDTNRSGALVISEDRHMWTVGVSKTRLSHTGEETVVVGGVGWREVVTVNRTGWDVDGNDSAYVVDLEYDGEVTRSFESDSVTARSIVANQSVTVEPREDGFFLQVSRDNESIGSVAVPDVNETARIDDLEFATEMVDDEMAIFAEQDGTRVLIAEEESYL